MSAIETFRAADPPHAQVYSDFMTAGIVQGNMGSLVVVKLNVGELDQHAHPQEHVGAVLEGEFSFFDGTEETVLRAGDLYRIPPNVTHGVRCRGHALIIQARADFKPDAKAA